MTTLKIAVVAAILIASVPAFAQRAPDTSRTAPAATELPLDKGPFEHMSQPYGD